MPRNNFWCLFCRRDESQFPTQQASCSLEHKCPFSQSTFARLILCTLLRCYLGLSCSQEYWDEELEWVFLPRLLSISMELDMDLKRNLQFSMVKSVQSNGDNLIMSNMSLGPRVSLHNDSYCWHQCNWSSNDSGSSIAHAYSVFGVNSGHTIWVQPIKSAKICIFIF